MNMMTLAMGRESYCGVRENDKPKYDKKIKGSRKEQNLSRTFKAKTSQAFWEMQSKTLLTLLKPQ